MHLAGNEELCAPDLDARCCVPSAAHSAPLFCDASCQAPEGGTQDSFQRRPTRVVCGTSNGHPLPVFEVRPFQLTRWKASTSVGGWVWQEQAQHPSRGCPVPWSRDYHLPVPSFSLGSWRGLSDVPSQSHAETRWFLCSCPGCRGGARIPMLAHPAL